MITVECEVDGTLSEEVTLDLIVKSPDSDKYVSVHTFNKLSLSGENTGKEITVNTQPWDTDVNYCKPNTLLGFQVSYANSFNGDTGFRHPTITLTCTTNATKSKVPCSIYYYPATTST